MIRIGQEERERPPSEGLDPQLHLLSSGSVQLTLGEGRLLLVLGHPATSRGLTAAAVRAQDLGTAFEVLEGNTTTVIWDVRDRRDDSSHLLHRVTDDGYLVSVGRGVKVTAGASYVSGELSPKNRTSFIPAGAFYTVQSTLGAAAIVVSFVRPSRYDQRLARIAVPNGADLPRLVSEDDVCNDLLWGIVASTYPDWRALL